MRSARAQSRGRPGARLPVVLPHVCVTVDATGNVNITVDGADLATTGVSRADLRPLLLRLAADLGPLRVEIHEDDGASFTDVVVPQAPSESLEPADSPRRDGAGTTPEAARDLSAEDVVTDQDVPGFLPGEGLVVAVTVSACTAADDGEPDLTLPPGLIARYGEQIVVIGRESGRVRTSAGRPLLSEGP